MRRVDVGKAVIGLKTKIILSALLALAAEPALAEFALPHIPGNIGAVIQEALRPRSISIDDQIARIENQVKLIDSMITKPLGEPRREVKEQLLKALGNDPQNLFAGGLPRGLVQMVDTLALAPEGKPVEEAALALKKAMWPTSAGKVTKQFLETAKKEMEEARTDTALFEAAKKLVKGLGYFGMSFLRKNGVVTPVALADVFALSKTDAQLWPKKESAIAKAITWFEGLLREGVNPTVTPTPSPTPIVTPIPSPTPNPNEDQFFPDPNFDPNQDPFNPNEIDQNQDDLNALIDDALNEKLAERDKGRKAEGAGGGGGNNAPPGGGGSGGGDRQPPQISGSFQAPPKGERDKPERYTPPPIPPPPDLTGLFALALANSKNDDNGDFMKFIMATNQRLGEMGSQDKFFELMMARMTNSQNNMAPIFEALARALQPPPPPPQLTVNRRVGNAFGSGGGGGAFANGMSRARLRRMPRLFPGGPGQVAGSGPVSPGTGTSRRPRGPATTSPTVSTASASASSGSAASAVIRMPLGRGNNKRPIR